MENQHTMIKGYRDLTQEEIDLMNKIKAAGEQIGALTFEVEKSRGADLRWVNIAKTDLQKGFMALTRAVAKPMPF